MRKRPELHSSLAYGVLEIEPAVSGDSGMQILWSKDATQLKSCDEWDIFTKLPLLW